MKKVLSYCVLVLLLLVSGCKKKETKEVSDVTTFTEYISVYPEKLISIAPKLDFYLNKKVDVEELGDDIITMNPKVKGKVEINNSILSFVPDEKLESNKEYSLTLHLDKLYSNVDKSLEDFTILLKTKPLQFSLALQAPSIYDKDWYYVEGSLNASDVIEEQKVAELVKANYNGAAQKIKFDVSSDGYTNFVRFKIDSLQRFADDKTVKVNWDGGIINSTSKGEREIVITGKSNFKVLSFDVFNDNKQRIDINFSDPINSNQNLKGLIQFVNTQKQNFTTKIKNNVISVYPKSSIRSKVDIEVFKGIKNKAGYTLKNNVIRTLYFEQLKPELSFIKSGTILPNSNNLKVNFTAVNLKAVDATVYKIYKSNVLQFLQGNNLNNQGNIRYVGRPTAKYTVNLSNQGLSLGKPNAFAVDLSDLVDVENGAVYRVELSYHKEYSNYSCDGEENTSTIVFGKKEVDTRRFDRAGYSYYNDDYYDDYNWNERKDPCKKSYYRNKKISRNFLASDLGVIVKKGNNDNTFVAVTNLLTTDPVNAAKVELINLQQQTIVAASTNTEGVASFESVQGAYFAKVSNNESTTYVKLNDGNALSMSKFDVSGAKLQKGIKGYIYGERGVWRPGDQMFLTFVLNDKANPIPEEHPIKFELVNPQGKIIDRKIVQKNKLNVYTYAPKTDAEAITGNWKLRVNVGVANFNKELKVETIKPNRLKIKVNTSEEFVKYGKPINGDLEVKWLHGAIARGLKFDIESKFSSTRTTFPKYDNYVFDDVTRSLRTSNSVVASGNLNNEGKVSFTKKTDLGNRVPGMVRASFVTKVYENGGDFSTDVYSMKVSPYKSYAGLNLAEEQQSKNYLFTDQEYAFNVASVNEEGKGIPNDLEVKVYKLNWRWWWSSSDDGLSYYDGSTEKSSYETKRVTTNANGKGSFSLKVDKGDWGRYLIKVKDKKSKHVTSAVVYFDWPSWYGTKRGSQDKTNATMLVFSSDKDEYNVNEKATVKFPSSAGGRALITIENGTEVLDHFWVETQDKQTDFSFPVLSTYTPNVFVNISLLQEHAQTKNDLPIRMYGAIPMLVNDPATKLAPEIQLADELQPESVAKIRVKEKNAKAMTYTIALVDDGLLDLTRFKTPNPWSSFYRRQSLGVKTWDIFDDVIGAYGGEVNQILSIGGDEAKAGSKNKKANRFKPMVSFLGPFKLGSGEVKTHEIKIPNYVGSVRAMVVASNIDKEAYGSDEKNAFVRKPVMVLASLPRKITPKETVTLPVTVFAMKENVKNVKVTVKPDPSYSIVGDQTQTIRFDQPDEKMAYFTLKVNDFKGIGKVRVEASSGSEKAFYEVEIDVLNPNPVTTEVKDLVLKSGEEKTIDFTTFGTKGTNTASVELSTLPPMNFTSRMEYLIRYPHGCVEQTTSGAFPQLYFPELFELPKERKQSIERNIKAAIKRLATFQKSDGGLSYWPGSGSSNSWGTSYAGHFLLEAAKRGYALPIGFKAKWLNYQKNEARRWRNSSKYYNNELAQAYRLYTLSLANSPDLASMNRLRETSGISNLSKRRLAAAYALIGKKSIAQSILSTINSNDYSSRYYYNYGSEIRDKAMSLETYTLIGDEVKAIKLAKDIAERLSSSEWMSTQTTSYSLLAIAQYALKNGENAGINTNYTWNGNKANVSTSKSLFVKDLEGLLKENKFVMSNNSNSPLYVRVYNRGILPVGEEKVIQKNFDVAITYKDKNNNRIDVSNLSQGTNFIAEITIRNATGEKVENIALTQYLPSGWEVVNTRFTEFGSNTNSATVDFTDIRDASISNYFTLQGYKSKTFRVLLNASYLGDYYLPGVQAEAMYDNDYISRTKGQWIKVVK